MNQYPHKLEIQKQGENVFDENTASFAKNIPVWEHVSKCREEKNVDGKITSIDSEAYVYTATIYCPKGTEGINRGDKIRVTDKEGRIRVEGSVKSFDPRTFNSRIWL